MSNRLKIYKSVTHVVKLPYPGKVFVEYGDKVEPKTLVARSELIPGMPAYLNVTNMLNISINKFSASLSCAKGQFVKAGATLASYQDETVEAPFKGWIEHVSYSNGYILLRQLVNKNDKPVVIHAAKSLGMSPRAFKNVVIVKEGENVVRKQTLAGDIEFVTAPMPGTIERIDLAEGIITIKPHYRPTELISGIQGRITKVYPRYGVEITTNADILSGVFGAGQKVTGRLTFNLDEVNGTEPVIAVIEGKVSADKLKSIAMGKQLRKWDKKNIVGVIAGSIDAEELVELYGGSVFEGVTGVEEFPISIIVTERFGQREISTELLNYLREHDQTIVTLHPESNCHPPIKLPQAFIYK